MTVERGGNRRDKISISKFRNIRKKRKFLSNFQERKSATTFLEFNESKNQYGICAQMEISFYDGKHKFTFHIVFWYTSVKSQMRLKV